MNPLQTDLNGILEQTNDIWEPLRGRAIFITGGTGFVGTWLVESLVWANRQLGLKTRAVLLSRNPDAFRRKVPHAALDRSIEYVQGDAVSFEFPKGSFPFVVHAATEQSVAASADEPVGSFDRDIAATRRVLEFARTHGTERLLFTSSGAIYGKQPPEVTRVPEEYPGAPATEDSTTAYGQAKRVSEFFCAMYASQFGFATVLARLFAFSGPYLPLDLNFAIGNFIRDVLEGGPIQIGGDGTPYRSYLYGADMAAWIWTLLFKGQSARPYNVGSGEAISIAELAGAVAKNTRPGTKIAIARKPIAGAPAARYVPSITRAKEELGLRVKTSLDESIRRMYAWNRELHSK